MLYDDRKEPVIVDLRGKYLKEAEKWKPGDKLKATLIHARSRYTPDMVLVFDGNIQVVGS